MSKGKGRGGMRKPRLMSDIEMIDADFQRNKRLKPHRKHPSPKPRHETDRRDRVGKHHTSPQSFLSSSRGGKQGGALETLGTWRQRTNSVTAHSRPPFNPRGRNMSQRLSIFSTASTTLSTVQARPWCDRCSRLNRRLHGYLLAILKNGEHAIDEWAYAVGASPDQMECEPAPERIIPEGFRRCSRQCQHAAGQTQAGAASHAQVAPELVPAPPSNVSQSSHALFGIPDHSTGSYARWAGPLSPTPLQVQQLIPRPGSGGPQRPAAGDTNPDLSQDASHHWAFEQPRLTTGPSDCVRQQNTEGR